MQHNLEQSIFTISPQELYQVEDELSLTVEGEIGSNLKVAEVVNEIQQRYREQRRWRRQGQAMWRLILIIGDGVLLVALLTFVLILIPHLHLQPYFLRYNLGIWETILVWGSLALALWVVVARITQAYELPSASNRFKSTLNILFALALMFFFWMVLDSPSFIEDGISSVKIMLLFLLLAVPALSTWRIIFAEIMCSPRFRPQAVILGTTTAGKTIAKELNSAKRPYATILGYISEDTDTDVQLQEDGIPVLGGRSVLHRLGQSGIIDMIITAVDYHVYPEVFKQVIELAQLGVSIVPMPIAYENMSGKIPVEHIGDQWYLALPLEVVVSPLYLCWRKVMDVIFGLIGTTVLLLIFPFLTVLIYLDSPGPIFYSQERSGLKGKVFRIYKFRSMHINAEHPGHAVWATKDDPRITRIGRFMRATHIDELPQVLNILLGDMSLIGPRPEREEFGVELEKIIPFYRCRLMVKPGLTGWAQVKYRYGSTDKDALIKLQYDLYYIKRQSFMLDIFIILQTVVEVLLYRGT